jgi:solute carrier family 25 protein 44
MSAPSPSTPRSSGGAGNGGVPREVTWEGLDKKKFFVVGAGMFSCVTCALYPLSVIKTRQMVDGSGSIKGGLSIVKDVVRQRGFFGLYQGFGTIVVGTLPIRMVYLSTLEVVKARARGLCETFDLPPIAHGVADAAGGATASMCSQVLGVPIDIISQRQMTRGVVVRSADGGAFYVTLVPIRRRRRGERRSLRTFPGVSLRPSLAFNPRPRRLSTSTDAFQLQAPRR